MNDKQISFLDNESRHLFVEPDVLEHDGNTKFPLFFIRLYVTFITSSVSYSAF